MIAARCNGCGRIGCDGNNILCMQNNMNIKYEWTEEDKERWNKALVEFHKQPLQFIPTWDTNKVIDFVNWYIELKGLGENNKLENQSIVDSFLRGENIDVWKENINKTTILEFKLSEKEKQRAEKFYKYCKKKTKGKDVHISYHFYPTGIGTSISVGSETLKIITDITDLSKW